MLHLNISFITSYSLPSISNLIILKYFILFDFIKFKTLITDARPDERGQEKLRNGNVLLLRTPPTTTAMLNEWFAMRLVIARHLRVALRGGGLGCDGERNKYLSQRLARVPRLHLELGISESKSAANCTGRALR